MHTIDLDSTIGQGRFGRLHLKIVLLCGLVILFDGYDLTIYGATVPGMIAEFGIDPTMVGLIGSGALLGMMLGAMIFGSIAERLGRRTSIVACVALYSVFTGVIAIASSPWELAAYRFVAGVGLGGVMPNAIALVAEYAPARIRNTLVSLMFSGYMFGGIAAALIGVGMIPAFGWRSLYLVGAIPLLLLPVLAHMLPEAPRTLLRRGRTEQLRATLRAINAATPTDGKIVAAAPEHASAPVASLFREGRTRTTLLLWTAFFMVLLMIYGLLTWLPQLMIQSGYPLSSSLSFLMTLFVAAIVITWGGGYLADRLGARAVLTVSYLVAAVFVAALGWLGSSALFWVYAAVALGGGATFSAQIFANALAAQSYPAHARSSGIGWALGVGRVGAIAGPLLGGALLTARVPLSVNFLAFAIPGVIAAAAIAFLPRRRESSAGNEVPETERPAVP